MNNITYSYLYIIWQKALNKCAITCLGQIPDIRILKILYTSSQCRCCQLRLYFPSYFILHLIPLTWYLPCARPPVQALSTHLCVILGHKSLSHTRLTLRTLLRWSSLLWWGVKWQGDIGPLVEKSPVPFNSIKLYERPTAQLTPAMHSRDPVWFPPCHGNNRGNNVASCHVCVSIPGRTPDLWGGTAGLDLQESSLSFLPQLLVCSIGT